MSQGMVLCSLLTLGTDASKLFIARLSLAASTKVPPGVTPSTSLALAGSWPPHCMILAILARAVADEWTQAAGRGWRESSPQQ